ncbi:hypothetical protein Ahy_B04g072855 [Arachis hypogaea]|uniref:PARP catalytic domain-containing protein n=1 Tax=Arachis hypogaea TaxID=3818 RepID=A0A444ZP01_ARAHY|nr:hypothetical protein Ahy_B04g072855 [Arachis hypogaea]
MEAEKRSLWSWTASLEKRTLFPNAKSVALGVEKQVVLLENVELILEAFDYLQLPFALKQGAESNLEALGVYEAMSYLSRGDQNIEEQGLVVMITLIAVNTYLLFVAHIYPIDMDDGVEVRHGALGLRQLRIAATHCKLEPMVANFVKVCANGDGLRLTKPSYRDGYTASLEKIILNETKRGTSGEEALLELIEKVKSSKEKEESRPKDEAAAAALEGVRNITVASHLIGDMSGSTIDDPLSETYNKLGCLISLLEKDSDDYDMIVKYLERTYEPVKVGDMVTFGIQNVIFLGVDEYGISIENIFSMETSACPPYEDIVKLPNKVLLWCGVKYEKKGAVMDTVE